MNIHKNARLTPRGRERIATRLGPKNDCAFRTHTVCNLQFHFLEDFFLGLEIADE
jgi:hypothetical protein